MSIISKFFNPEPKKKGVVRAPFTSNVIQRFGTNSYGPLQTKDYIGEYKNWVFACVTARAEEVGNIQLFLRNKKTGEKITEHDVINLLNSVNDGMNRNDLFEYTQAYKDLDGNAFWFLARSGNDGKGPIKEIYLLRPDKVRIVIDKNNPLKISGYLYTQTDGQIIPFAPTEILHHKNFDPRASLPFPARGMGIVEAAAYAIDTDNSSRNWNLNFFKNGARPDGILVTDGEASVDADEYQRLTEEWEEEHKGEANAHKISIMSGGLKYVELTRNQKDMDFIAQRTFSRDEILALFRTPKSIIGITEDVNRATAETAIYVFAKRTVKPLMQKIVNTLNEFLLPEFDPTGDLVFDFISPVEEDRAAIISEYDTGLNKWLSTNDIRRREGLEITPNGEKLYQQGSMVEFDTTPVPQQAKSVKNPVAKKKIKEIKINKESSIAQKKVEEFIAKMPKSKRELNSGANGLETQTKEKYIGEYIKRVNNYGPLKRKLNDYFATQEKEVQKNLREEMKGLTAKEFKYKALSDVLFDKTNAIKTGISLITPFIEQYLKQGGQAGNDAANGDGFNMDDSKVQEFIPKRAEYFAETINNTTSEDLLNSIQDGIDAGESLDEISARVADIYGKAQDYRTDMIARTEVAAASNFGSIQGYKQAGVEKHQWIVVDPKDEDCLENDGDIEVIGDAFPNGDTEPPVHPNCQCTTIPIFDDNEE